MVKKKKIYTKTTGNVYDFSNPFEYFLTTFWKDTDQIKTYCLNVTVGELLKDFNIFEDLNNVQSWPISTLIQRELDHERACNICKDYLLKESDVKYFPPLVGVLIPIDNDFKPADSFPDQSVDEQDYLYKKYIKDESNYEDYGNAEALSGGIYKIPFDELRGDLIWNKEIVSAIIIDGQHRYKALYEASLVNKEFLQCKLMINVIDLIDACKKNKAPPTDIARDLFVTINNTPKEVDEARLVLMDDKDALATFTQVLIDDSFENEKPAVSPELIDWECNGGKHDIKNSLTGVLVLRQVILSAIFDESKVSTIDDKINLKNVRKWKQKIDNWLDVDGIIENKLSKTETLTFRFELAQTELANNGGDDDEEESIFLFSYSSSVSKILKERFKDLFISVFRSVYNELEPYKQVIEIAKNNGVFNKSSDLNNYYRSFVGKRKNLIDDNKDLSKSVRSYEAELSNYNKDLITNSVMGQKSVFKALFDGFLSGVEDVSKDAFNECTIQFVEQFNNTYKEKLSKSDNVDENFFSTKYRITSKGVKNKKAGSVATNFWKGIILKSNDEIDYSRVAVQILSQIIQDIMFFDPDMGEDFKFTDSEKLVKRHCRLLNKVDSVADLTDKEREDLATNVVKAKENAITKLLTAE